MQGRVGVDDPYKPLEDRRKRRLSKHQRLANQGGLRLTPAVFTHAGQIHDVGSVKNVLCFIFMKDQKRLQSLTLTFTATEDEVESSSSSRALVTYTYSLDLGRLPSLRVHQNLTYEPRIMTQYIYIYVYIYTTTTYTYMYCLQPVYSLYSI